uniref:Solute carrier family 12 member 9 n=2 Tax=Lutzomyia longipalpis TaxID=7200 RepID=A0A1B0CEI6_LUTLO
MLSPSINNMSTNTDPADTETAPIAGNRRLWRNFGASSRHEAANPVPMGTWNSASVTPRGLPEGLWAHLLVSSALWRSQCSVHSSSFVSGRIGQRFIVGNAGLFVTLLQFVIAYTILLFTVSSVCAISTNGAVDGGGVYFMISRTLGADFGGSIGTLFFLANVVGCGLCVTGCAEGLIENFGPSGYLVEEGGFTLPDSRWWRFFYCSLINAIMLIVCLIGATMFAKTSVMILGIVSLCLMSTYISFLAQGPMQVSIPQENQLVQNGTNVTYGAYTGLSRLTFHENLYSNYSQDYTSGGSQVNFAIVFGVLFSGVTGIMAGANMSGELKNPSQSIPRGTLSAVAFTFVCYILLAILMAATSSRFLLQNNFLFLMPINLWKPFIAIGITTATFSAALSNMIGSSRVLEALAKDQVYGSGLNFVIKGTWKGNPVVAVFTSWFLVQVILLIGSLNTIAQINSVLFMLSYLATNLACLGIELTGAPNFRPSFKYYSWHTCFFGLIGTLIMMFVINPIYSSSSIILCLVLVIGLHLFSPASQGAQWGSISQALMFHQVRKYLLMLDSRKDHVKFWRPQMLLLVSSPRSCCPLIEFVNDLKKGGLYVLGHVKLGDYEDNDDPTIDEYKYWLSLIDHLKVKAFAEVTLAKSVREGTHHLIRISGMVMLPTREGTRIFPTRDQADTEETLTEGYVAIVDDVLRMRRMHFQRMDKGHIGRSNHIKYIDVWTVNVFNPTNEDPFDVVSQFMLQLSCILNMLPIWKKLHVRVFLCETQQPPQNNQENFTMTPPAALDHSAEFRLSQQLKLFRINATIHQIPEWSKNDDFTRHSAVMRRFTQAPGTQVDEQQEEVISEEHLNRSRMYMQKVNELIRERSDQTACTFIYLPAPPHTSGPQAHIKSLAYLDLLTELTADLPPTILVHGIHAVNSTTL